MKNDDSSIKYLIKFVSKRDYAESLLDGNLFMHTAHYYHELEKKYGPGQGDLREGNVIPGIAIYKNTDFPIFCLYAVTKVQNGLIRVNQEIIRDFKCESGFAVVMDYNDFDMCIPQIDTGGYAVRAAPVRYGTPTEELIAKFFTDQNAETLFVKHPYFKKQQEFRIVVFKSIPRVFIRDTATGKETTEPDTSKMSITYSIPGGLRHCSELFELSKITVSDGFYLIPAPKK